MFGAHMCVCVDGGPSTRRGSKLIFLDTLPGHTEVCKPHHLFGITAKGPCWPSFPGLEKVGTEQLPF